MIFRYWVEFGDDGDIEGIYKSKEDCSGRCKEYIVKLIPINRSKENIEKLDSETDKLLKSVDKAKKDTRRLQTEINKVTKNLRRIKL